VSLLIRPSFSMKNTYRKLDLQQSIYRITATVGASLQQSLSRDCQLTFFGIFRTGLSIAA
ncbi:hypothetical protein, partial [Pseudomonas sp. FSL R10-1339]|uniref:hypothetical protein n=1 Tax=Pseudomonas sp. FSL R10-1339 TaxID=2662196 RepID=UPI001C499A65